jgi:hypothetical protein
MKHAMRYTLTRVNMVVLRSRADHPMDYREGAKDNTCRPFVLNQQIPWRTEHGGVIVNGSSGVHGDSKIPRTYDYYSTGNPGVRLRTFWKDFRKYTK